MPVSQYFRVSVRHPETNVPIAKSFSIKKYGLENCKKFAKDWKDAMKAGLPYTTPEVIDLDEFPEYVPLKGQLPPLQPTDDNQAIDKAMLKFPVKPFNFERGEGAMKACSFAVIGSSKSGKTTFLKYLLKEYFNDEIKLFMTQSPQAEIYDTIKKNTVFCPTFMPELLRECYKINKATDNHYEFMMILDDIADVKAKNHQEMSRLLCLYRNSAIGACVVGQDAFMLSANGRANTNYVCLFYQNTDNRIEDNIKHFLRSYFPRNLTIEEKIDLYKKLTSDHSFLFINNLENTITRCRLKPSQLEE